MCVPCGNSLKILGNIYVAVPVEEPVCVFRWGSLLLTFVFSRHGMSDGQTFFCAKHWALENHLARFIGIIGDRSQCRGQVIVASGLIALGAFTPDFRESAVKPASQPLRPWQTYGIAIESQKEGKDMKISFWLDVLCHFQRHQCFLQRITVSLNFWENSTTTIIIITCFDSPPFVLSPPRGLSH